MELPVRDPAQPGGLRGRRRKRGGRQALRGDAALRCVGPARLPRGGRAEAARAGRSGRARGGRGARARTGDGEGRLHRLGRDGPPRRLTCRRAAAARDSRARRQGPDARVRGRRPRPRGRGRALGQLLQLRPGVLGRRADLRGAAAPGAVRRGADPPRACAPDRSRRGARDRARAADLRAPARARRRAGLGGARSRRGATARRRAPGHRPSGLVLRADDPDRRRSRGAGPARGDLRAGRHGLAVRGRGRGGAARERLEFRPRRERLDARPRKGEAARAPAGCGLGLDERRLVLLRRGPGLVGRDEGIGLRAHALEARPLRALAGQVRRPRPRPLAGGVVVSVQRGRSWTASAGWRECSIARGWGRRFRRRGGTGAGSSRSDGGTFRTDE